ncbi:MAG: type III PLP-dependent enzyme [Pseudomonadota bacterium]
MDQYSSADHIISQGRTPSDPVICLRPHAATRAAKWFTDHFQGHVFFAMKANPDPVVLHALTAGGVTRFDVASIREVRHARNLVPEAELAYMHPIKGPEAIAEAYHDHGVRIFALDHEAELEKILAATGQARDLTLCVRVAVANPHAKMSLATKFGIRGEGALHLLQAARLRAARLGVTFHAGSQTMAPLAFTEAMDEVETIMTAASVLVDILDVGGGFPAPYPGMDIPELHRFTATIQDRFDRLLSARQAALWCEPGRALCAEASSVVVRAEGRRGQDLYLNDGIYGTLYDAGHFAWRYPARVLGKGGDLYPFHFYGPTCDDAEYMKGPFMLPKTVQPGDYIEVGMVGAYGQTMAAPFNGFGVYEKYLCTDDPFGSVYAFPTEGQHGMENVS